MQRGWRFGLSCQIGNGDSPFIEERSMNKTLLASAIALALGASTAVCANPTNSSKTSGAPLTQTAPATSDQSATTGAAANEGSLAVQVNKPDSSDNSNQRNDSSNNSNQRNDSSNNSNQKNNTSTGNDRDNKGRAGVDGYGAAANNNSTATATFTNSFNHEKSVAVSKLSGTVSHIKVYGIGNTATNRGDANGDRK